MSAESEAGTVREAVGVFDDHASLQGAIDELLSSGFDRAELSLLASETAIDRKLGRHYCKVSELEDAPGVPRIAYESTESLGDAEGGLVGGLAYVGATLGAGAIVASGGTLAAALAAATMAGGAGGVIGSIFAALLGEHRATRLREQIEHGGLLLWVRTWDDEKERRATDILGRHSGRDVHIHTMPAPA